MEGTLNGFTFLDPAGNLLAWSGQLDNAAWQTDPLLSLTGAISDPLGTSRAWRLTNSGGAEQAAGQTLAAAGRIPVLSERVRTGGDGDQRDVDDRQPGGSKASDDPMDADRVDV